MKPHAWIALGALWGAVTVALGAFGLVMLVYAAYGAYGKGKEFFPEVEPEILTPVERAARAREEGDMEGARAILAELLAQDPSDVEGWLALAAVHRVALGDLGRPRAGEGEHVALAHFLEGQLDLGRSPPSGRELRLFADLVAERQKPLV